MFEIIINVMRKVIMVSIMVSITNSIICIILYAKGYICNYLMIKNINILADKIPNVNIIIFLAKFIIGCLLKS